MKLAIRQNKWILPLASGVIASLAVTVIWIGWANLRPDPDIPYGKLHVSMPVYSSIGDLTAQADAVVVGTVHDVAAKGVSRGAEGDGIPIPFTLYEFEVTETLKGQAKGSIYIFRSDPDMFPGESLTELREDQALTLFLGERRTQTYTDVTIPADRFYVPLSFDNGVFDISTGAVGRVGDETIVEPRGTGIGMFAEGSEFRLSEIKQAIEPVSDEVGPEAGSDDAVPGSGPGDAVPGSGPGDAVPGSEPGDAVPGSGPGGTGSVGSVN